MNQMLTRLAQWFDSSAGEPSDDNTVDWLRVTPFILLHVGCLGVFWVGWSWVGIAVAASLYLFRMFAVTAFYHRYFSHRAFRTNRAWQFVFAVAANSSGQRGPLWWAAHHRHHHRHSEEECDAHSPHQHGFLWSHVLWITTPRNFRTDYTRIPDFARYPELRLLDRFDWVVPVTLAVVLFAIGGAHLLVWGFFISTVVLFHGTCLINSAAHLIGRRRYQTNDDSRNSLVLAIVTLGEGWHNNHHYYPGSVRQGHRWWEIDPTWYGLLLMERLGIVSQLKGLPARLHKS
ncbi:MAG: acyl-CoA desaturase [Planctomycetota bacterium]|jgi:stearoyl-CoA desaturase (delta-9 desaturase)